MKRYIALLLACIMLLALCACGSPAEDKGTADNAVSATDAPPDLNEPSMNKGNNDESKPTPAPTPTAAPVYENPLNGEILDAPYTGRVFGVSICNVEAGIPHVSLNKADVVFETYVNGSIIRHFALFSNIQDVDAFGAVRSSRPMWNDLIKRFDGVLVHSGGKDFVLSEAYNAKIPQYNIDHWDLRTAGVSFRDNEHGRIYENALMGIGAKIKEYAQNNGTSVTQEAGKTYGMKFTDNGTPAAGETANEVNIRFKHTTSIKDTTMKYDSNLGEYVYWQYGKEMRDDFTDEVESFDNLIVILVEIRADNGYHKANFKKYPEGEGYYACGGKIVPIKWTAEGTDQPFKYYLEDGSELQLQRGNTYVALCNTISEITYK